MPALRQNSSNDGSETAYNTHELLPSRVAIRKILSKALPSDSQLNAFCLDYFQVVYAHYSAGMDRLSKVNLLIEIAQPSAIWRALKRSYTTNQIAFKTWQDY